MNPMGVVYDLPLADYLAVDALSATGLRLLSRSAWHYYSMTHDPGRPRKESTPAMKAGTLAHCALLEPDSLLERYIVRPEGIDGRTKEGKAWLASVPPETESVTAEQLLTAQRQSDAIRKLPEIAALLSKGTAETSFFWVDDETKALCKGRADWVSPAGDGVVLLDIKTTQEGNPKGFSRSVVNYAYAGQCAWYCDGYEKATGIPVLGFVFVAVESDYPHAAAAYMLPDEWIDLARKSNGELLKLYAECVASNNWPSYSSEIQLLEMPAWLLN